MAPSTPSSGSTNGVLHAINPADPAGNASANAPAASPAANSNVSPGNTVQLHQLVTGCKVMVDRSMHDEDPRKAEILSIRAGKVARGRPKEGQEPERPQMQYYIHYVEFNKVCTGQRLLHNSVASVGDLADQVLGNDSVSTNGCRRIACSCLCPSNGPQHPVPPLRTMALPRQSRRRPRFSEPTRRTSGGQPSRRPLRKPISKAKKLLRKRPRRPRIPKSARLPSRLGRKAQLLHRQRLLRKALLAMMTIAS